MTTPFRGLSKRVQEIEIGKDKIKVKPKVKDAEMFITMKAGDLETEDAEKITKIMVEMIRRANPDEEIVDIEDYVAMNYGSIFQELSILFGFTTRAEMERMRKERIETQKK